MQLHLTVKHWYEQAGSECLKVSIIAQRVTNPGLHYGDTAYLVFQFRLFVSWWSCIFNLSRVCQKPKGQRTYLAALQTFIYDKVKTRVSPKKKQADESENMSTQKSPMNHQLISTFRKTHDCLIWDYANAFVSPSEVASYTVKPAILSLVTNSLFVPHKSSKLELKKCNYFKRLWGALWWCN